MERQKHTINADGRPLGRLATEIAVLLRGKNKPDFAPHKDIGDFVVVENVSKIKLTGKKMEQKTYFSHSGYLGSGKHIPILKVFDNNPCDVLIRAVSGMLPKNKLRAKMIKRLTCQK